MSVSIIYNYRQMEDRWLPVLNSEYDQGAYPKDLAENYGCDACRMYILFEGCPENDSEWNEDELNGVYTFLNRFFLLAASQLFKKSGPSAAGTSQEQLLASRFSRDMQDAVSKNRMNRAAAILMKYEREMRRLCDRQGSLSVKILRTGILWLRLFAPCLAQELFSRLPSQEPTLVFCLPLPMPDQEILRQEIRTIPVQINGKVRGTIQIPVSSTEQEMICAAAQKMAERLKGKKIRKTVCLPGQIINFVTER